MKPKITIRYILVSILLLSGFKLIAQTEPNQINFNGDSSILIAKYVTENCIPKNLIAYTDTDFEISLESKMDLSNTKLQFSYLNALSITIREIMVCTQISNDKHTIYFTIKKTNFSNLKNFQIQFLKMDGSLIANSQSISCYERISMSGIMFYDAQLLNKYKQDTLKRSLVLSILSYYSEKSLKPQKEELLKEFENNEFLKNYIESYWKDPKKCANKIKNTEPQSSAIGKIQNLITKGSGLDVTPYANAIADIMIQHAKEELTVAFFNRFENFAKDNPEFQVMFPKTTSNLSNLLSIAYPQMLPALRNGFHEDIEQITYHLDDVLELPKYADLLKNFPEVRVAIRSISLVHDLETGASNAADLIKEFAEIPDWEDATASIAFKNMYASVKLASVFSESLRFNIKDSCIWIPAKDLKVLANNPDLAKLYIGLLLEKTKNINFYSSTGTPIAFSDILKNNANNIVLVQNKIAEFSALANRVDNSYRDLNAKMHPDKNSAAIKISNEDIYTYINVSIDAVDFAFSLVKIFDKDFIADDYMTIVRKSNNLYRSIYKQEYTQAMSDAVDILIRVNSLINIDSVANTNGKIALKSVPTSTPNRSEIEKLTKGELDGVNLTTVSAAALSASSGDDMKKIIASSKSKEALKSFLKFIDKVKPYALFMANMVEAKSEEEIKAALENAILPVGSSSIKKNACFNVSIQSYLGARVAIKDKNNMINNAWSDNFGITAPIGIAASWGFGAKSRASVSLFATLFDIGAIVDYKLKLDTTADAAGNKTQAIDKKYEIKLGQIISPGGYLVIGSPWNLPIALGIGGQYGPGLSSIQSGGAVTTNPYWAFRAFLAVDIPFLTVYNKRKNN